VFSAARVDSVDSFILLIAQADIHVLKPQAPRMYEERGACQMFKVKKGGLRVINHFVSSPKRVI
jgi:hypothetical protein